MIWKQVGQSSQGLVRPYWSISCKHEFCMQPLQFSREKSESFVLPAAPIHTNQYTSVDIGKVHSKHHSPD